MNTFRFLLICGVSQLFSACNNLGDIDQLSPLETDSLKSTKTEGLYQVSSAIISVPSRRDTNSVFAPKKCAENEVYWIDILYPVTVCTTPDLPDELLYAAFPGKARDSVQSWFGRADRRMTVTREARFRGFPHPLYCRTHNGPWIAEVKKEGSCEATGQATWKLSILGIPEPISWTWFGEWSGRPDIQYLSALQLKANSAVDCDPADLTNCGNGSVADPDHPAITTLEKKQDSLTTQ